MSGQTRADEREPLLPDNGGSNGKSNVKYQSTEEQHPAASSSDDTDAKDIAAQIEAIKEKLSSKRLALALASTSTCLFVVAMDGTLFVTLLNDVSTTFSASDLSFWIGTSYMLSSCITAPIYGRLNDVFGRRNALICGVTLFLAGTALCAVAPSMLALIAARSLAGLGGGGITTCYAVILGDLVPLRKRAMYQSVGQLVFSLGNATGGPVGGLLADLLGWRLAIGTQVPLLTLALFLQIFFLQLPDFPKTIEQKEREEIESQLSIMQILRKRLDFVGILLLASTCLFLMIGLSFLSAGNLPFTDVRVWVNFALFFASFVLLIWYEAYIAREPIIPLHLLKTRMVGSVFAYYFFSSIGVSLYFYFPVYFRSVLLQSASETGLHFISLTVSTTVGTLFSGALITKTGRYRAFMLFCSIIFFIAPLDLSTWSTTNIPSTFTQNFILAPFGFGGAAMSTIMVLCVLASCPRELQATALGLVYLARSLGSIVGVAVFGAQIQYVLTAYLLKHITGPHASRLIDRIRKNANANASLPDDIRPIALRAYSSAFRVTNVAVSIIFLITLLIVLFIKEIPLNGAQKPASASSSPEDAEVRGSTTPQEPSVEQHSAPPKPQSVS